MAEMHCIKPHLTKQPNDVQVKFGNTVYFHCSADGSPEPEISWFHDGKKIKLSNDQRFSMMDDGTLVITDVDDNDKGSYECMAKNDIGETVSTAAVLRYRTNQNNENTINIDGHGVLSLPLVSEKKSPEEKQTEHNAVEQKELVEVTDEPSDESNESINDSPETFGRPSLTVRPTNINVEQGESIKMDCEARGSPAPLISWRKQGLPLPNNPRYTILAKGALFIIDLQFSDEGTYECVATNNFGSDVAAVELKIQVSPIIVEAPRDYTVIEAETASFTCRAHGYPYPTIKWVKGGVVLPVTSRHEVVNIEDGSVLTIDYSRVPDQGIYECIARNSAGEQRATAELIVRPKIPPSFITSPEDANVALYSNVELPCSATGDPRPNIYWTKNGRQLRSSVKYALSILSLVIYNITESDEGIYHCIVTNDVSTIQTTATITVSKRSAHLLGNRYLNITVENARHEVNTAINKTIAELLNNKRTRSPGDLLTLFRLPSNSALALTRATEIFEQSLENILRQVGRGDRFNTTHTDAGIPIDQILSPSQIGIIANLSGCEAHRTPIDCSNMCFHKKYRTLDGTCNNLREPMWGASLTPMTRLLNPAYENGISTPVGWDPNRRHFGYRKPSARLVSLEIMSSHKISSDNRFTHMLMQWGQFLDHDIVFTPQALSNARFSDGRHCNETCNNHAPCFPIKIPENDPRIRRHRCIGFTRSSAMCGSGTTSVFYNRVVHREQINQITSFIDASNIYGSSQEEGDNLRDLVGNRGRLKVGITLQNGKSFLPYNIDAPVDCQIDPNRAHIPCFIAGDHRANEQLGLLSMHTLWMREHNRIAANLSDINPHWDGDMVYHEARKIVGATMQHISYNHWLPNILGPKGMRKLGKYSGYNPNVRPSIINSFATGAFRFGHGLISPIIFRLNENYETTSQGNLPLHKAFFAPYRLVEEGGVDPILRGLYARGAKAIEPGHVMNTELTEKLFKLAHTVALDLAALNIQRGRDHGLPNYNDFRRLCNLTYARTFDDLRNEIKSNDIRRKLEEVYGHPSNIDLFVGGMNEDVVPGAKIGPTFMCIIVDQFRNIRDGDRFWYESPDQFTATQLAEIKQVTVSSVFCNNHDGTIQRIPKDIFRLQDPSEFISCREVPQIDLKVWSECCHDCQRSGHFNSLLISRNRLSSEFSFPHQKPVNDGPQQTPVVDENHQKSHRHGHHHNTEISQKRMDQMEDVVESLEAMVHDLRKKVRLMQRHMNTECIDSEGRTRRHKSQWTEGNCKRCKCKRGRAACITEICSKAPCTDPKKVPGQCCPICQ
ncbi:peroxidasin homolog [Tubulanus polymorphus]|uniref:peroxidasin homolog n=1 Tax=Tubulanus polymorphus TaxID=672921 RepID=UPI003DA266EB